VKSILLKIGKEVTMRIRNSVSQTLAVILLAMTGALAGPWTNASGISHAARENGGEKHELSASELKARLDNNESIIILDARKELSGEMIKGAIHVPLEQVQEWAKSADKSSLIVAYCGCPHDETSQAAVHTLRQLGFENAFSLIGGLGAARKAGLGIVTITQ
jgi:rhodanese-related sulfurtransferase